jgi:hypothetical protein
VVKDGPPAGAPLPVKDDEPWLALLSAIQRTVKRAAHLLSLVNSDCERSRSQAATRLAAALEALKPMPCPDPARLAEQLLPLTEDLLAAGKLRVLWCGLVRQGTPSLMHDPV